MNVYVTVSEKREHSAQNVLSSYDRAIRSTEVNSGKIQASVPRDTMIPYSFLPAQERECYVLYAGRHTLSKT